MFVTAVCFLFLLKLKWQRNKNICEDIYTAFQALFVEIDFPIKQKNMICSAILVGFIWSSSAYMVVSYTKESH